MCGFIQGMSRVNHQDLGQLNGPIVLFGGPYSNLQALDALFDRVRALGVGRDRMICTGDVVAYCADAHAVSDRMQDSGIAVVAGNCEKQLAAVVRAGHDFDMARRVIEASTVEQLEEWVTEASDELG